MSVESTVDHSASASTRNVIEREQRYLVQSYRRPPFVLERGEGVYLFDREGRRYLDMVAGIAVNALGYADPGMREVMERALDRPLHVSNLYHTEPHARLAEQLVERSFADRVFFCNSGAEAIEGALKFARKWARREGGDPAKSEIVAFEHAFHGRTMGALSTTFNAKYREPFEPLVGGVTFVPFNDVAAATAAINERTAAVLVEPLQGEGGIAPATAEFLQALRHACDEHGAALIFDEIQCGLGRSGTLWAYEQTGVEPDLMTVAKPLGGGLPIGAILATESIASQITAGDHGSTFAGGPYVCAVASHIVARVSAEEMLAHVRDVGAYLGQRLGAQVEREPRAVEARGRGLMWGLEFVPELPAADIVTAGYEHGLLLVGAGRNTVRFVPPLIVETSHIDELMDALDAILEGL